MSADARRSPHPSRQRLADVANAAPDIRTGDLLLCAGRSPMSRLIQRATGSPWSHVALLARVESIDRILVLESVESIGVRAVPITRYLGEGESRAGGYDGRIALARHQAINSLSKPATEAMLRRATDLLGRRYDTAEILRIAGRIAFGGEARRAADRAAQPPRRDDLYICSEYVWECLRAAEIEIPHDRRGFIAPADFAADPAVHLVRELTPGSPGGLEAAIQ
jgi:hypothetical protein